ncbi:MAG TPA: shikimate dehydrogenase [Polyangiaceae bacterium]|nr:shikimate dehydrogenase [Polyangiaceae bacterium]
MSRFILIGHPVGHSLSPSIHRAAYAWMGQAHEYQLVDAPDRAAVEAQVDRLRRGVVAGANVTVPHKRLALALADRVDVSAERVGAANTLVTNSEGEVVAYNTDALGLADVLGELVREVEGGVQKAVVLGNGGAALGAVVACQHLGVGDIVVTARAFGEDVPRASWPHHEQFSLLGARPLAWVASSAATRDEVAGAQLVLQATSAGMKGAEGGRALADALPWSEFAGDTVVYDLIYNPPETPVLGAARARGLVAEGGLSMLVAQAQLAIRIWLGVLPPRAALLTAARQALEGLG